MNALNIPGAQTGSFLANLALSVAGTPLAGVLNTLAGAASGTIQLSEAAQRANLYALVPELARFGLNIEDLISITNQQQGSPLAQAMADLSNPQLSLQANDAINATLGL